MEGDYDRPIISLNPGPAIADEPGPWYFDALRMIIGLGHEPKNIRSCLSLFRP